LSEGTHEPKLALSCVQRAMQLVEAKIGFGDEDDRKKMAAITLNNMSCMYYRMGCHKVALRHAERALRIEASSKKWDNPAVTHLNMAVILSKVCPAPCALILHHDISQLKRHEHAAQHCECALAVLEDGHVGCNSPTMKPPPGKMLLDSSVRAIAHFNLAVEREFLNQLDSAAHHYNMYTHHSFAFFIYISPIPGLYLLNYVRSGRSLSREATAGPSRLLRALLRLRRSRL